MLRNTFLIIHGTLVSHTNEGAVNYSTAGQIGAGGRWDVGEWTLVTFLEFTFDDYIITNHVFCMIVVNGITTDE